MCNWKRKSAAVIKLCGLGIVLLLLFGCNSQNENSALSDSASVTTTQAHVDLSTTPTPDRPKTLPSKQFITTMRPLLPTPIPTLASAMTPQAPTASNQETSTLGYRLDIISLAPKQAKAGDSVQLKVEFQGPLGFLRPVVRYQGVAESQVLWLQRNKKPHSFTWTWKVPEDVAEGEANVEVKAWVDYTTGDDFGVFWENYEYLPYLLDEEWDLSDSATFQVVHGQSSTEVSKPIAIPRPLHSFDWHSTPTLEVEVDTKTSLKPTIGELVFIEAEFRGPPAFVAAEFQYPGILEPKILPSQLITRGVRFFWGWRVPAEVPEGEVTVVVRAALANTLTDDFGGQWIDFENLPAEDDWEYTDSVTFMVIKK